MHVYPYSRYPKIIDLSYPAGSNRVDVHEIDHYSVWISGINSVAIGITISGIYIAENLNFQKILCFAQVDFSEGDRSLCNGLSFVWAHFWRTDWSRCHREKDFGSL